MIEIRNLKAYEDMKAIDENIFGRGHIIDTVNAVGLTDNSDDDGHYLVHLHLENISNKAGLFDTFEKAEKFYNALKELLPDSATQNAVIDHKDFE